MSITSVAIMDVTGKLVSTYLLKTNESNLQIDAGDLNSGVYFYQFIINGTVINSDKLIIIK
ncbi:MAG: T9SS type A sorting domain-containing protein [Bacteroidota bacterium]|nr:T9SS type A sorting domain-containing protein [Bacteroidota bacterium]